MQSRSSKPARSGLDHGRPDPILESREAARHSTTGAVELRGVTKRYGEENVVDAIDAAIRPGEFFSLLGPSGSGKTTTLMMIAGFAAVDAGRILVDGADIADIPPQRRGFGMVFQNYAIFPHLNVFENVAFPLRARHLPADEIRQRVASALELVQLKRFAGRFSRQLSGGQQQRVAIARAIVFHPSVVLMDEPLGALDKNLRYQMQIEIKDIQRRLGMTVIYVTHDQEEAMNMSDRIAIMSRGRIEQIGEPTLVYARPANAFVGQFLGEANLIAGSVEASSQSSVTLRTSDGLRLQAQADMATECGTSATLFVRPEQVTLSITNPPSCPDGSMNQLEGRVSRRSFLGNMIRYVVEVGAATKVTVDVPNLKADVANIDAPVVVCWSEADSLVLRS